MKFCQLPLPVAPARMATYRRSDAALERAAFVVGMILGALLSAVLFALEAAL